jgi:hypothetical protein
MCRVIWKRPCKHKPSRCATRRCACYSNCMSDRRVGRILCLVFGAVLGVVVAASSNLWMELLLYWVGVNERAPRILQGYWVLGQVKWVHIVVAEAVYLLGNWTAATGALLGYTSAVAWLNRHNPHPEVYRSCIMVGCLVAVPTILQNLLWLMHDMVLWRNWWSPMLGVVRCFSATALCSISLIWWGRQSLKREEA